MHIKTDSECAVLIFLECIVEFWQFEFLVVV